MSARAATLVLALAAAGAPASAAGTSPPLEDLAPWLEPLRRENGLPALAAAVVFPDRIAALGVTGSRKLEGDERALVQDAFAAGSVSWSMTATLAAILVGEGALGWDTTLEAALPAVARAADPHYRGVTLAEWIGQRSGLPPDDLLEREVDWSAISGSATEQRLQLASAVLRAAPDVRVVSRPSFFGYVVAGAMLESRAGGTWEDLLDSRLFRPLRMETATFENPSTSRLPWGHRVDARGLVPQRTGPGATYSAAFLPLLGVRASVADLARFAQLHLRGGAEGGVLAAEAFARLHEPAPGERLASGWRLSSSADGARSLRAGSCAATLCSSVVLLPRSGVALVVLTNAGGTLADGTLAAVEEALVQRYARGVTLRSTPPGPAPSSPAAEQVIRQDLAEGRWEEAERRARELLSRAEREHGAESIEVARAIDLVLLPSMRRRSGTPAEARALAERAVAITERVRGRDAPELVRPLGRLGELHASWSGDLAEAERVLVRAVRLGLRYFGPDDTALREASFWLGRAKASRGTPADWAAARELFDGSVRSQELELVRHLEALAEADARLGDPERAIDGLERALEITVRLDGDRAPHLVPLLVRLGELLLERGDWVGAERHLEDAWAILDDSRAVPDATAARLLEALGQARFELGQLDEARTAFERAAATDGHAASVEVRLAAALRGQGETAAARAALERLAERAGERPESLDLPALAALAEALQECGAAQAAREVYALAEPRLAGSPHAADLLNGLGRLLLDAGDAAGAGRVLDRALAAGEAALGPEHLTVGETLGLLARRYLASGEPQRALAPALRAERLWREHLRLAARALPERQALRFAERGSPALDAILSIAALPDVRAVGDLRDAWDALVRSRAVVLDEMAARRRSVAESPDAEVRRLARDAELARVRLARLALRPAAAADPAEHRATIDAARADRERAEVELARRSAAAAREHRSAGIGYLDVHRGLPSDGALVAFARHRGMPRGASGSEGYVAFVVRTGGQPAALSLGTTGEIDALVSTWRDRMAGPALFGAGRERELLAAGTALRQATWDRVEPLLGDARRVLIVPDGALHFVNFGALPADAGGYLVERGPLLHYLSTERDVVDDEARPPRGRGVLAVGGPSFDEASSFAALGGGAAAAASRAEGTPFRGGRSACRAFHALRFGALPESASEAENVAAAWRDAATAGGAPRLEPADEPLTLVGAAATEDAVKRHGPGRRVMHLATHGFFLEADCSAGASGTRGVGIAGGPGPAPAAPLENPLLESGLALAGANLRDAARPGEEDGILTAEEIAALDLAAVEWVVLSACDTGLGALAPGEGVLGLRRAFVVAGAGTLIMSLWPVEDRSTAEWMRALYAARFAHSTDTAEAMRDASVAMLAERRRRGASTHPFFWGAFVAAGDWR